MLKKNLLEIVETPADDSLLGMNKKASNEADEIENPDADSTDKTMLIVFPVMDEEYALPIDMATEVVSMRPVAPIPQAPAYVLGAANVRGTVLTVLDPAIQFGLIDEDEAEGKEQKFLLVLKSDEYKMALVVDEVPSNLLIDSGDLDVSVDTLTRSSTKDNHIKGIIKKENRMIILIDVLKMIHGLEMADF